jgi:dTMP kinase
MASFIVLEGLDGSGKSTQVKRLRNYFKMHDIAYDFIHFPRMDDRSPFFGELIARFLRGEFGDAATVDPYLVAMLYAGDREHAAASIRNALKENKVVLVDRYVISNIAFQCAKTSDKAASKKLQKWIIDLEYGYYGIPKPNLSIFLHVPFSFVKKQLSHNRDGNDRDYLKGATDIHEQDLNFQQKVESKYLEVAEELDVKIIDCRKTKTEILDEENIHQKIIHTLSENSII